MKNRITILVSTCLLIFAFRICALASDIVWEEISAGNFDLKTVLVDSDRPRIIYIGTRNAVFKTEDAGLNWKNVLLIKGQNKSVNFLVFGARDKNFLYAATGSGLFYSTNQGKAWKRVFRGKNYFENECTVLAVLPQNIYLGTKGGLFISSDSGRNWRKASGKIGNSHILAIACDIKEQTYIYVACVDGVFRSKDAGQSWERIFVANSTENGNDAQEKTEDQDEEERISDIRDISIDPHNLNYLYLASSKGIYRSQDKGLTWEKLPDYGLLDRDTRFLLVSKDSKLYAVTKSGIFEFRNERWQELSFGLAAGEVRFLDLDNQDNLYAACDKGLFKTKIGYPSNDGQNNTISLYCKDEPTINEVQQAAIKYAEVESEKIKEWRKKAKMKAILPKLTVGLDRSETTNYEIYTSATTHYVYDGPDDKSSGWDVTLSWELGDLIWSEAQTSIDVRSRLMVQLREDILDEVTKLYFERLRVKMELDNLSIEERKKRTEKELRLEELTAYLDALTGGYFSRQLRDKT